MYLVEGYNEAVQGINKTVDDMSFVNRQYLDRGRRGSYRRSGMEKLRDKLLYFVLSVYSVAPLVDNLVIP